MKTTQLTALCLFWTSLSSSTHSLSISARHERLLEKWSVRYELDCEHKRFPTSAEELGELVSHSLQDFYAGRTPPSPNQIHNQVYGNVIQRRPIAQDQSRVSVELDVPRAKLDTIALLTAGKLQVPVTLLFPTIFEAARATTILQKLYPEYRDHIEISVLTDDITLHNPLSRPRTPKQRQVGDTDPTNGVVMIVGASLDRQIAALQRTVIHANAAARPVVLLSPRLEYSGPYEQSVDEVAMFGGAEPPNGPTPFLLRDFCPPILSVCHAASLGLVQDVRTARHDWEWYTADGTYLASTQSLTGRPTREIARVVQQVATAASEEGVVRR